MNSKKPTDPGYTAGKSHFIVGTDTGVGKTFCTCALLHAMQKRGIKVIHGRFGKKGMELSKKCWGSIDVAKLMPLFERP